MTQDLRPAPVAAAPTGAAPTGAAPATGAPVGAATTRTAPSSGMRRVRRLLLGLAVFQGLSTLVGFVELLLAPHYFAFLLDGTAFAGRYVLAAVLLGAVVGGFQWAAVAVHLRAPRWLPAAHALAGLVMLGWIAGECLVLGVFMWPHALWGGVGAVQLLLVTVLMGAFRPPARAPTPIRGSPRVGTRCTAQFVTRPARRDAAARAPARGQRRKRRANHGRGRNPRPGARVRRRAGGGRVGRRAPMNSGSPVMSRARASGRAWGQMRRRARADRDPSAPTCSRP